MTGVLGAGKTLAGLDVATRFQDAASELHSVSLSGNGPLVAILTKVLAGDRWRHIHKPDRRLYLKNAYRVLLTRARQGLVIVVPHGAPDDPTRDPAFYDGTYRYLQAIGIQEVQ